MELLSHPALQVAESRNLPVPSWRMGRLFYEFLGRYQAWQAAKRQEMLWIIILIFLGAGILLLPYLLADRGFVLSVGLFAAFYFAALRCLKIKERVNHLYVNVNILYHHLVGKLEVGFCEHTGPCRCVENFRRFVAEEYHISLVNGSPK